MISLAKLMKKRHLSIAKNIMKELKEQYRFCGNSYLPYYTSYYYSNKLWLLHEVDVDVHDIFVSDQNITSYLYSNSWKKTSYFIKRIYANDYKALREFSRIIAHDILLYHGKDSNDEKT